MYKINYAKLLNMSDSTYVTRLYTYLLGVKFPFSAWAPTNVGFWKRISFGGEKDWNSDLMVQKWATKSIFQFM